MYKPPEWCIRDPEYTTNFVIEIIKEGILLDTLPLLPVTKTYYTFGRAADQVDIPLDHPSVSRVHAVLVFKNKELYLFDNHSTHGTFINKQRLSAETYEKLIPGSIIRFGESTRTYVVDIRSTDSGKEISHVDGISSTTLLPPSQAATITTTTTTAIVASTTPSTLPPLFSSTNYPSEPWYERLNSSLLNEKEQLIYDRLRKKVLKLTSVQEETQKIKAKELTGLNQNQILTLAKNEEIIEELQTGIENDEDLLKDRLESRFPSSFKNMDRSKNSTTNRISNADGVTSFQVIDNDDDDNNTYDKVQKSSISSLLLNKGTNNKPVFILKKGGSSTILTGGNKQSSSSSSSSIERNTIGLPGGISIRSDNTKSGQSEIPVVTESVTSLTKKLGLVRQELVNLTNEEQAAYNDQLSTQGNVLSSGSRVETKSGVLNNANHEKEELTDSLDTYMAQSTANIFGSDDSHQRRQEQINQLRKEEERLINILKRVQTPYDISSSNTFEPITKGLSSTNLNPASTGTVPVVEPIISVSSSSNTGSTVTLVDNDALSGTASSVPMTKSPSNKIGPTSDTAHISSSLSTILHHYHKDNTTTMVGKAISPPLKNINDPSLRISSRVQNVPESTNDNESKKDDTMVVDSRVSLPSSFLIGVGLQASASSNASSGSNSSVSVPKKRSHSPTINNDGHPPTGKSRTVTSSVPLLLLRKYDSDDLVDLTVFQTRQ